MIECNVVAGRIFRAYRAAKGNDVYEYESAISALKDPVVCGVHWPASYVERGMQKRPNGACSALNLIGLVIDYQVKLPIETHVEMLDDVHRWLRENNLKDCVSSSKVNIKSRRLHGKLLSAKELLRATWQHSFASTLKEYQ